MLNPPPHARICEQKRRDYTMLAIESLSASTARCALAPQNARRSQASRSARAYARRTRGSVVVRASATTTVSGSKATGTGAKGEYDVVVVGGGLSGLCTAQVTLER